MAKVYLFLSMLVSAACMAGCSSSSKTPVKEFEGVITYQTTSGSWKDSLSGPQTGGLKVYYSHGNILRVHMGGDTLSPKKEIYPKGSERFYSTHLKHDTLFWYDATANPGMELVHLTVKPYDALILGHKCEVVDVLIKHPGTQPVYYEDHQYIFSLGYLPIDPDNLANFKYAYFDQVMAKSGSYCLAYRFKMYVVENKVLYFDNFDALSVKEQPLDPKIFELDKLPQKELKY